MSFSSERARNVNEFDPIISARYYSGSTYTPAGVRTESFFLSSLMSGVISIANYAGGGLGMRRTWAHIRKSTSEIYVLWFPVRGQLFVSQDSHVETRCLPGEFVITCGDRPSHARADPGEDGSCEQIHVIVPSHLLRSRMPTIDRYCARVFSAKSSDVQIGLQVYSSLFKHGDATSDEGMASFVTASLDAICGEVRRNTASVPLQIDTKANNLQRVLRFINQHLASQGLTAARVAEACNMSRRYLHYLLKHSGLTFREYLWEARLDQARKWLHDPEFDHFHIVDIAYMAGFRSASHFSSAFKARFGCAPRVERLSPDVDPDADLSSLHSNS